MKSGDVVTLMGGGPTMTVEDLTADRVQIAWFDVNGTLCRGEFRVEALKESPYSAPAGFHGEGGSTP